MAAVHLFFPENDLALAQNTANYTPPPAAVKLRRAGATLPLWYGAADDRVITDGVNARWLADMRSRFGLETKLYICYEAGLEPQPWGWSKTSRRALALRGVALDAMPTDEQIDRIRNLSHRRTAARISEQLGAEVPIEATDFEQVSEAVGHLGTAVVKLPWSSSGRGIIPVSESDLGQLRKSIEGAIHRQGSVMVERRYEKRLDFAALYTMHEGRCAFEGLSVFDTIGFGSYSGNILAPQEELYNMICAAIGSKEAFDNMLERLPAVLEGIIGCDYSGSLGVDMMAVADDRAPIVPAVELNLRMTMGHVCHRFYRDHIEQGLHGRFAIEPNGGASYEFETHGDRLRGGAVDLAQPGSDFSFIMQITR